MAIDRLPNHSQMNELLRQQVLLTIKDDPLYKSDLEREYAAKYIAGRNGKVFARKIWNFATNTTTTCEAMLDAVGLKATMSTNLVEGVDDFEKASQIFQYENCNYVRDADGTARPIAIEGRPGFRKTGKVDVGPISPTFWWKLEYHGTYNVLYMSDSEHPELGLIPWVDAVTADGKVLPFYVVSAYPSVDVDGVPYSQPGIPMYNQSYNAQVSAYAKKGAGYCGTKSSRNALGMIFSLIKYGFKSIQKSASGCTDFNVHVNIAKAETGTKRVLIASQGKFNAGDCVSVGSTGTDRASASLHTTVNRAVIKSIETVSVNSTNYTALNLDVANTFDTTTDLQVHSMPSPSGQTDAVIGHKDGSYLSNTDGCHSVRIHGMEFMNGQGIIVGNAYVVKEGDFWTIYAAPKGVKTVANAHTNYVVAGRIPYNNGTDMWSGDFDIDINTGTLFPCSKGSGNSVGTGDYIWEGGANLADGTARELYTVGSLDPGSHAGLCSSALWAALSGGNWAYGSCD